MSYRSLPPHAHAHPTPSATATSAIRLDPVHNGSTIRKAFLAEAALNLLAFPLITHPATVLSYLLLHPRQTNPASILFTRLFGGLIVGGLTPALLAGYPNTRSAIESRRTVYLLLGMGEVFLIPMLVLEGLKKQGGGREGALSGRAVVGSVMCLFPPLLWRIYVLFVRPELLGRYSDVQSSEGDDKEVTGNRVEEGVNSTAVKDKED